MSRNSPIHDLIEERLKKRLSGTVSNDPGSQRPSSIDRFFWEKGGRFLGTSGNVWPMVCGIIGGSYSFVAILMVVIASNSARGIPMALPLLFGVAAIAAFIPAIVISRRNRKSMQSDVKLSSSGKKLLYRLGRHIGWHDLEMTSGFGYAYAPRNSIWRSIFGVKTAGDILTLQGGQVMENGCSQYNRISGLLKLAKDSKGRSTNMAPQVQAAGDEAMVSLINHVALLEENPETQSVILSQCLSQTEKLRELADRYEEMLSGPVTLEDRLSSTTVMDSVLDQMRMEAQAHEELRTINRQES